jgi:hypothetical protein
MHVLRVKAVYVDGRQSSSYSTVSTRALPSWLTQTNSVIAAVTCAFIVMQLQRMDQHASDAFSCPVGNVRAIHVLLNRPCAVGFTALLATVNPIHVNRRRAFSAFAGTSSTF